MAIMYICSRCKMPFPMERMENFPFANGRICKPCSWKIKEEEKQEDLLNSIAEDLVRG